MLKLTSVKIRHSFIALVLLFFIQPAWSAQVRLITIGPGDAFWSAFGHTAIAIDDRVYGFGYFSFTDDIVFDFIENNMLYDLGISDINYEARLAEQQGRAFSVIKLQFDEQQVWQLQAHLEHHYLPENRSYPYDYFSNNCATKIRDILNDATAGKLFESSDVLHSASYHDWTFPATNQGLMNLGLAMGYGWSAYEQQTDWALMAFPVFLEQAVAEHMDNMISDRQLYLSNQIEFNWLSTHWALWSYVILFSVLMWFKATNSWATRMFVYLQALIGLVLTALWLLTPHAVADWNFNVLLFSPFGLWAFGRQIIPHLLLAGWVIWALIAAYLHAWYLFPVLIPGLISWFNLRSHHQEN